MEKGGFNSFMAFPFSFFSPFAGGLVILLQEQKTLTKVMWR
jgi:hypothetical protein